MSCNLSITATYERVNIGGSLRYSAADGIFDSTTETINIDQSVLLPGRHALEVRMRDGAGNETTETIICYQRRSREGAEQ